MRLKRVDLAEDMKVVKIIGILVYTIYCIGLTSLKLHLDYCPWQMASHFNVLINSIHLSLDICDYDDR